MILIADSGSTKCDWIVASKKGKHRHQLQTPGINPTILSAKEIEEIVMNAQPVVSSREKIREIHFYGAGCGTEKADMKIKRLFGDIFQNSKRIEVSEDIVAAVHATTNTPGVVCILGTGSNCCYFDGTKVIQKVPALGYLLSDEGSGNFFGKRLLKSYYMKTMPSMLARRFEEDYEPVLDEVFRHLYRLDRPNRYLASYARFAFKYREHPFIKEMVQTGIDQFLDTYLPHYKKELAECPIHFVGSVAYHAQDMIAQSLAERGYQIKSFVKKPIDNLVRYIVQRNTISNS